MTPEEQKPAIPDPVKMMPEGLHPIAAKYLKPEDLGLMPDVAAKKASDRAIAAGMPHEAHLASRAVNEFVFKHGTSPQLADRKRMIAEMREQMGMLPPEVRDARPPAMEEPVIGASGQVSPPVAPPASTPAAEATEQPTTELPEPPGFVGPPEWEPQLAATPAPPVATPTPPVATPAPPVAAPAEEPHGVPGYFEMQERAPEPKEVPAVAAPAPSPLPTVMPGSPDFAGPPEEPVQQRSPLPMTPGRLPPLMQAPGGLPTGGRSRGLGDYAPGDRSSPPPLGVPDWPQMPPVAEELGDVVSSGQAGGGRGGFGGLGGEGSTDLMEAIEDLTEQVKRLADLMERGEKGQAGPLESAGMPESHRGGGRFEPEERPRARPQGSPSLPNPNGRW